MRRIHKNTVKARLRRGKAWQGYITPNKVNASHVRGGWHIGCYVSVNTLEELERVSVNYAYYNCCGELGRRVVYWQD